MKVLLISRISHQERYFRALAAQTEAHRKHDQALSGTPLDEAPGRYMIVQQIPIPT